MSHPSHDDLLSGYSDVVLIKQGGQKVTYRAVHPTLGTIALKIGAYVSPEGLERIRREVMLLKEIDSPYYPKNYDFQVVPGDRFVILEQFIPSRPLSECFSEYQEPEAVLNLLKHLVIGLNIIWERNTVHRDVKPDNVLITPNLEVKIIDLGIARMLDLKSLTQTLALRGPCTPFYAAPEQLWNRKTRITARTDQFCLGIILVQLLLGGRHPFDPTLVGGGSIVENILAGKWHRDLFQEPSFAAMSTLATKLLGREPYQRYPTTRRLLEDIERTMGTYQ